MRDVSAHKYVVLENIPFSTRALLILLMSAFSLQKNQPFFGQNSTFTQSTSVRAALKIFKFCFQFLQDKRLLLMKI